MPPYFSHCQCVEIVAVPCLDVSTIFKQDAGAKLYRRSMYIYWKRSAPMPVMTIFDAPTREKCVMRRSRTNTPLQALVTLNDPQFVEAARALAERLIKEGADDLNRFDLAYQLCTSRNANDREKLRWRPATTLRSS